MFKGLKPIVYGGREVWPLVEGGKGVAATNHASAGAWAAAGGIGTVSAVNADSYDPDGKIIPQVYKALTRRERHEELIDYAIEGAVQQVRRAFDIAGGKARSTSTCYGKWAVRSASCTVCWNARAGLSPESRAARACPTS